MKIINRKTFMELPDGTIYTEYEPCIFSTPSIKGSTYYNEKGMPIDWVQFDFPFDIDQCGNDLWGALDAMQSQGASFPAEFESGCRDGQFEDKQLYAVLERDDVARLIVRLQGCMATAYPPLPEQTQ